MRDRGQAVVVIAGVVVIAATASVGVGVVGQRLLEQQRARSAADAAALAVVTAGAAGADAMCRRNGCVVVAVFRSGDDAEVTVRVGRATATARATWRGGP